MAKVAIPNHFFLDEAKKEYTGSLCARLAGEFFQNSIDAQATIIHFKFNLEKRKLSVIDNGNGMSLQEMVDGLLTFGGSIKKENSCGAFGKAKFLLLFSQENYTITSRDIIAKGETLDYTISEGNPYFNGTQIDIEFSESWPQLNLLEEKAKEIMALSNVNAQVFFNDVELPQAEKKEIELSNEFADISDGPPRYLIVRFNGLFMFRQYVYSDKGYWVDCKVSSREALAQNRESFRRDSKISEWYDSLRAEMSNNSSSGLKASIIVARTKENKIGDITFRSKKTKSKLSQKHQKLVALSLVVSEMIGEPITAKDFGFIEDEDCGGLCSGNKVYLNPNILEQDNYEYKATETTIHEICHWSPNCGSGHDEKFISNFGRFFVNFISHFPQILTHLRRKARDKERELFGEEITFESVNFASINTETDYEISNQ